MATKVWHAREAVIKLAASTTITTAAALDTFFSGGTAVEGVMKDITVTEPASDVEKIDLLGEDSDTFQNAEGEEKPFGMVEISGTAILPGDEVIETFIYPTGTAIGGTHTRYRPGQGTRKKPSFLLNLDDSTDEVNYAGENCWLTAKDVKVTGADGHLEVTLTLKCLPRDWYGPEFKD